MGKSYTARFAALNSTYFFETLLLTYLNQSVHTSSQLIYFSMDPLFHIHCLISYFFQNVVVKSVSGGICDSSLTFSRSLIVSPTWDVLLNYTLQESDNLYAEVWMRRLGVDSMGR